MKLTMERSALIKALGHVQSVVERRNTIPILSNVLLSADKDGATFSATDLDMEIIDQTAAQVGTGGQITAPAHTLYEIVRKLPDGADVELKFAGDDPRLSIQAGRSRFNLPVLPVRRLPGHVLGRPVRSDPGGHQRPDPPDRQDPLRDLHRGDALLPERPLPSHRQRGRSDQAARGGHRRPPPGARRDAGAGGRGRRARA